MLGTKRLKDMGVLGINRRNTEYTLHYNKRRFYPLVDDKLQTNRLALEAGIVVPELYGVLEIPYQVRLLPDLLAKYDEFVIKPCRGSGGEGILVFSGRMKGMYRMADGTVMTQGELNHQVLSTMSGIYSLGGHPDKVLVEYRVRFDPVFEAVSYLGVPDIRIIVFQGVPVMSMVRLPTRMSEGKANLHQGAMGAGIDITTGVTFAGVWQDQSVTEHPDTGNSVIGLTIPDWDRILEIAARCYELTGLGYQGVDIVLDRDRGPMILELNARPGLIIQVANKAGLLGRLKLVEDRYRDLRSIEERITFAKERFQLPGDRMKNA